MSPVVGLSRELNPEYWKLLEDSEQLINRWQRLNVKLTTFRVPRFPFFGSKTKLKEIQKPFSQLQADTNRWLSRAGGFFVKNPPQFESGQDLDLTRFGGRFFTETNQPEMSHAKNTQTLPSGVS